MKTLNCTLKFLNIAAIHNRPTQTFVTSVSESEFVSYENDVSIKEFKTNFIWLASEFKYWDTK